MRKLKRPFAYVLLGVMLACLVMFGLNSCQSNNQVDVKVTPVPTNLPDAGIPFVTLTPNPVTATPTPTHVPTATPVQITATPVPTATPVRVIATSLPTATPWTVTPTPQIIYVTQVPVTPTPVVVYVTQRPTYVPVPTSTLVPITPTPRITAKPTPTPTPKPTATPKPTSTPNPGPANLEAINRQLSNMSSSNEILQAAGGTKTRDLYNVIDLRGVDQNKLFSSLKSLFVNCIAHSIDIQFSYDGSAEARLLNALNSAVCSKCGRLVMVYKTGNTTEMANLMKQISDVSYANQIMLDFLQEHTSANPTNMSERWTIVCGGH